ncbi:MAG TPA: hypothetical protein VF540_00625 [Segetibacter sp.]|jgi:hypothetical protein
MEYKILVEDGERILEASVIKHLEEGWQHQGGVSVLFLKIPSKAGTGFGMPTFRCYQAMTKEITSKD